MDEVVKLKSTLMSCRDGDGQTEAGESAAKLVEGILRRKSFYFQQRTGKLDMRAIGRVDVERVVKEVDIDTLQAHLENIAFADVTEDDLRLYSDQCFVNLFRLSQLLLEYLLSVQDTLATSLEALSSKHASIRGAVDKGRADLHATHEQARALKREVRQKRATITRYEQLLALPAPAGEHNASGGNGLTGHLHACLTCGKMFTTTEFLQQHIVRKHAYHTPSGNTTRNHRREPAEVKEMSTQEDKGSFPSQLRLFVQTSTGTCLDMIVQAEATVAQLRGYINSTAGFRAATSKRLLYRGTNLHDHQTLRECRIPTDSQLVLLDFEMTDTAGSEAKSTATNKVHREEDSAQDSEAMKQIATLVTLMRQQMEWTKRSDDSKREQQIGAAEALEIRMRKMEASLPRRLEDFMKESVGDLHTSLRKALTSIEEASTKRSNAGVLQDDDEEERLRLASLSGDVERIAKENAALVEELAKAKVLAASAAENAKNATTPGPDAVHEIAQTPLRQQVAEAQGNERCPPPFGHPPPRKSASWELTFPSEGTRPSVTVIVSPNSTCEAVCESIAAELDVAEARIVLRDTRTGAMISIDALSSHVQSMYEEGFLELDMLQGSVVSDRVVDELVDYYERHIPANAKDSGAISQAMAEMEIDAKRHTIPGRKGPESGKGLLERRDQDLARHAEKQVASIRAQLSATLTGVHSLSSHTNISKSISQTAPDLAEAFADRNVGGVDGLADVDVFGDETGRNVGPSLKELEMAVEERKHARPEGIQRQMTNVSKSVEEQLSILLEEAEEELQHLEEDSLGSQTFSSTNTCLHEDASSFEVADNPRDSFLQGDDGEASLMRRNNMRTGAPHPDASHIATHRESAASTGSTNSSKLDMPLVVDGIHPPGMSRSDWNKTLDTSISIPAGPEERADEHEANASLEMLELPQHRD